MYSVHAATALNAWEVIRGDRSSAEGPGCIKIDVAVASSVDRAFQQARPDAVLLLAAMSDIDRCEARPEEAFATNARGAENVANACARSNARLLFTSSGAVFDGKKHGYNEEDETSPVSIYGKTKEWAEKAVQALMPSVIVIRFALVLGFARNSRTNSMLDSVTAKWKAGEPVYFPTWEERNPIDAASLGQLMTGMLADESIRGTYHVGASDSISRYELGRRCAERAGVSPDLVRPQQEPMPGRAPRGADQFLLTQKIHSLHMMEIPSSSQVIERCFL